MEKFLQLGPVENSVVGKTQKERADFSKSALSQKDMSN
jgi:hypothetical protein